MASFDVAIEVECAEMQQEKQAYWVWEQPQDPWDCSITRACCLQSYFFMQFGLNMANTALFTHTLEAQTVLYGNAQQFHTQIPLLAKIQTQRSDMFHSTKLLRLQNPHSNIGYTTEVICRHSCVWARHKGDTLKQN